MPEKKKKTKAATPEPEPATAVSQTENEALMKFHDELKKTGHVEVAANILRVHKILTKDAKETANGVVEAVVNSGITTKGNAKIALAILCSFK